MIPPIGIDLERSILRIDIENRSRRRAGADDESNDEPNEALEVGYGLEELIADCRQALRERDTAAAREAIRLSCIRACTDDAFVARWFSPEENTPRRILYEDPDLGFCVLSHVRNTPGASVPHDHGSSWAIYAQVEGHTDMTGWRVVDSSGESSGDGLAASRKRVEVASRRILRRGDAFVYDEGDIHSPRFDGPAKFLRIEGRNLQGLPRNEFDPVEPEPEPDPSSERS